MEQGTALKTEDSILKLLPSITDDTIKNGMEITPVFDPSTNMIHFQSAPYIDTDGFIKIKRITSRPVQIVNIGNTVTEHDVKVSY